MRHDGPMHTSVCIKIFCTTPTYLVACALFFPASTQIGQVADRDVYPQGAGGGYMPFPELRPLLHGLSRAGPALLPQRLGKSSREAAGEGVEAGAVGQKRAAAG